MYLSLSRQVRFKTAIAKSSDDHCDNDDNGDDNDDNNNNYLMMMMLIIIITITTLQCNGFALSSPRESFVDARKAAAPAQQRSSLPALSFSSSSSSPPVTSSSRKTLRNYSHRICFFGSIFAISDYDISMTEIVLTAK